VDKYNEQDRYCYDGTLVLKNKLNIQNEDDLENAEKEITYHTAQNIIYYPPPYNVEYLQKIHTELFSTLYVWAGDVRDVSISKGDTVFCLPNYISYNISQLFRKLYNDKWLIGLEESEFYDKLAYYYCEFNMIHPFREGNGRVQRIFFEHLVLCNNHICDWSKIDKDTWMKASIIGVGDEKPMINIFTQIIINKRIQGI